MKLETLRGIMKSKQFKRISKKCISFTHIDTQNCGLFHVLILFFDKRNVSEKQIERYRKQLINSCEHIGESLDKPDLIKFYGNIIQLIIS